MLSMTFDYNLKMSYTEIIPKASCSLYCCQALDITNKDRYMYQNNERLRVLALLNSPLFCFKFSQFGLFIEVYRNYIHH